MRNRSTILTGVCGLILAFHVPAHAQQQPASQEKLQESLDNKLKKGFIKNAAWERDYDEAKTKAAGAGKLIFVYFTRSYAP